jgi:hypothetical protein
MLSRDRFTCHIWSKIEIRNNLTLKYTLRHYWSIWILYESSSLLTWCGVLMVRVYISPHADVSTRAAPGEVLALPWHLLLCFAAATRLQGFGLLWNRGFHVSLFLRLVGFIAGVPMGAPACFFVQRWYAMSLTLWMPLLHTAGTTDDKTCHVLLCSGKGLLILLDVNRILIIQQAVGLCFWTGARLSLPSRASEGVHATGNHRGPCSFGLLGSNMF